MQMLAQAMAFNNAHVVTIARDWDQRGRPYWAVMFGTALNEGFPAGAFQTRRAAIREVTAQLQGATNPAIVAYGHGDDWKWIDVPHLRETGAIRLR